MHVVGDLLSMGFDITTAYNTWIVIWMARLVIFQTISFSSNISLLLKNLEIVKNYTSETVLGK